MIRITAGPRTPSPRDPSATAALGVAAVTFRATLAGTPVRGPQTDRVLAGFRRDGADRGRWQAAPLRADGLAAILATADLDSVAWSLAGPPLPAVSILTPSTFTRTYSECVTKGTL